MLLAFARGIVGRCFVNSHHGNRSAAIMRLKITVGVSQIKKSSNSPSVAPESVTVLLTKVLSLSSFSRSSAHAGGDGVVEQLPRFFPRDKTTAAASLVNLGEVHAAS